VWKSNSRPASCIAITIPGYSTNDVTTYACPFGYAKVGWDTTGSGWRNSSTAGVIIGQNDYATIFCCQF
ncbi:shufflon system plasmid conjugative transfer pilus tip adhesin PilV, partial [Pseudomonas sp. FW305-3-2-15-A-R2A1]